MRGDHHFVYETGNMEESLDEEWWVNSGAYILKAENGFQTVQGELPWFSSWRIRYFSANPRDSDSGAHPQNIFRLIRKMLWENGEQTVYARIQRINVSESPERDAWSGIFLLQRYKDQDTVYYAGLRQDGAAVIKKKIDGTYYTMAYAPLFGADLVFQRDITPNLLPGMKWIGIRTITLTLEDGIVSIRLFIDKEGNGAWEEVLEAQDNGQKYGGIPIIGEAYGGIRSDFMDMEFKGYDVRPI